MSISSFLIDPMRVKRPVYHTYSKTFAQSKLTGSFKSAVRSFGFPIIFLLGFSSSLVTKLNLNGTIRYADSTITVIFLLKMHLSIFQSNSQVYLIKAVIISWYSTSPMHSTIIMGFLINYYNCYNWLL